jgi:hypothetical protein
MTEDQISTGTRWCWTPETAEVLKLAQIKSAYDNDGKDDRKHLKDAHPAWAQHYWVPTDNLKGMHQPSSCEQREE